MKYILSFFAGIICLSSFAQLVNPSDTFAYETFGYLKQIDSSALPGTEKARLSFEKISHYIRKNPNDVFYGQQLLWFTRYFDEKKVDSLYHLFDHTTQTQMIPLFTPLKLRSRLLPGEQFPELILSDTLKHTLKISDLKGKIILIDIWASWCKPCRVEMPGLISLYEKYKSKGLVVIAISLDEHKTEWVKAIHDDSLPFMHYCDLVSMEKNKLHTKWGILSIPYNFLIDKNGTLIDKEISMDKLEKELSKLL